LVGFWEKRVEKQGDYVGKKDVFWFWNHQ
jgi:hypothetical protein